MKHASYIQLIRVRSSSLHTSLTYLSVSSFQEAVFEQDLPRAAAEGAGGDQLLQPDEALRHPRARALRHLLRISSPQVKSLTYLLKDLQRLMAEQLMKT